MSSQIQWQKEKKEKKRQKINGKPDTKPVRLVQMSRIENSSSWPIIVGVLHYPRPVPPYATYT